MLEFEVIGDRNNFIDLQRTGLEIVARVVQIKGNVLRTHATDSAQRDTPYLINNPFSSFFSECTMSLTGEKISSSKANFSHKSFIETEFSHGNDAKKTWLAFQGSYYEDNPSSIDSANGRAKDVAEPKRIVAERKLNVSESNSVYLVKLLVIFYHVTNILSAVLQ